MILRRADIARVFEGDPGMAGLKQHRQHLAPERQCRHGLEQFHLAACGFLFVAHIGFFEGLAEFIVQINRVRRREQGPIRAFHHPAHEQIGNPVRGVHVVRAAAIITSVFAQLEEFFNIQMPGFEIRADRTFALAALVHGHGGIVHDFKERHDALRFAVGAFDIAAERAHWRPVIAETTSKFGQQGVFFQCFVNAVEIIGDGGEVARRQLRAAGTGVKQRGGGRHEIERRQHIVKLNGTRFAVDFIE